MSIIEGEGRNGGSAWTRHSKDRPRRTGLWADPLVDIAHALHGGGLKKRDRKAPKRNVAKEVQKAVSAASPHH